MKTYSELVKRVAMEVGDERGSKCGYDLLKGLEKGNADKRAEAWERYLEEIKNDESHTDAIRDGVWVPAFLYK